MSNFKIIQAPWSSSQVTALNLFQAAGRVHPFTCGSDDHRGPSPVLVATPDGWICPDGGCPYVQTWAHDGMTRSPSRWIGELSGGAHTSPARGESTPERAAGSDFDGCRRACRQRGEHTYTYGCEETPKPEETVTIMRPQKAADGLMSLVGEPYTAIQLAQVMEEALRQVPIRLGPNALGLLRQGQTVPLSGGEIRNLALAAAHAIIGDDYDSRQPPRHLDEGGNAEDCEACMVNDLPYPWICPGGNSNPKESSNSDLDEGDRQ